MKKYKVYYSLFNILEESQAEVEKLRLIMKGLMGGAIFEVWRENHPDAALVCMVIAGLIDILLGGFWFKKIEPGHKP